MKQKKLRRYKGTVFYKKKHTVLKIALLCVLLAIVLTAGYLLAKTVMRAPSDTASSAPSSAPSSSVGGSSSTTSASSSATTAPSIGSSVNQTTSATTGTSAPAVTGDQLAAFAKTLIGSPFKYGGAGPNSFDNPGLVYYVFKAHGINVSRKAATMMKKGTEVAKSDLLPGDVVFFYNEVIGGNSYFIGVYVGEDKFVCAKNPNQPAGYHSIKNNYFKKRYITARRYTVS